MTTIIIKIFSCTICCKTKTSTQKIFIYTILLLCFYTYYINFFLLSILIIAQYILSFIYTEDYLKNYLIYDTQHL